MTSFILSSTMQTFWQWFTGLSLTYMAWNWLGPNGLRHIPTVGTSIPVLAYINGLRYMTSASQILRMGYKEYARGNGIFKVALADQWLVLVAGRKQLEEFRQMSDDQVSDAGGLDELLAVRYIVGADVVANPYHIPLIHMKLTRNLDEFHAMMKDEIWSGFDDTIGDAREWSTISAFETAMTIVSRTSNRVFVGMPYCRDPEFLSVAQDVTLDIAQSRFIINLFPPFMKPFIAPLVNKVPSRLRKAYAMIGPLVEERRKRAEECKANKEEWDDKPNDLLTWLIEEGAENGYSNESSVLFLLLVEFVALHTTAMSITHALYHLAADPSLVAPLRAEVDTILAETNGELGTRRAVNKMKKIDSFLRESQRLNGANATSFWRKTLQPVTFSSGITIPAGVFLSAPASATHMDEDIYPNPEVFDPWRFVGAENSPSLVSTSSDFLAFGHGRHACPGRHFAAYQMKLMLAFTVLNYDIKMPAGQEGIRPKNKWIGNAILPDRTAKVLFKKRNAV
ncbi:cytochrome P450 [Cristinia sonorae]|uniref:Cytochrome P450 n=1 Tax=Cristinia sonorae TaxID=1940300 RepID=A0A8K0XSW5_9AGAR|nr:cytochrome P450 [Cristinia sonorae]